MQLPKAFQASVVNCMSAHMMTLESGAIASLTQGWTASCRMLDLYLVKIATINRKTSGIVICSEHFNYVCV